MLYQDQNRLAEAEPLYQEALAIRQAALPAGHPAIATGLANLAGLYQDQNRLAEAEPLYQEALAIYQAALPAGYPDIATSLNNLAVLYFNQGRYAEAENKVLELIKLMFQSGEAQEEKFERYFGLLFKIYQSMGVDDPVKHAQNALDHLLQNLQHDD
jgi:tetratricopeptide (TPR) repeat protein